jgi:hypothetical protein
LKIVFGVLAGCKSGFQSAGYTVKGTDNEEDDAEIEYGAKDGSGGQVALRAATPATTATRPSRS